MLDAFLILCQYILLKLFAFSVAGFNLPFLIEHFSQIMTFQEHREGPFYYKVAKSGFQSPFFVIIPKSYMGDRK